MTWFDRYSTIQGFAEAHRAALESMKRDIAAATRKADPQQAIDAIYRLDIYADFLVEFEQSVRVAVSDAKRALLGGDDATEG